MPNDGSATMVGPRLLYTSTSTHKSAPSPPSNDLDNVKDINHPQDTHCHAKSEGQSRTRHPNTDRQG